MTATLDENSLISGRPNGALILRGRAPAHEIREECAAEIKLLKSKFSILPGLAVVRAGEDPASVSYAGRIMQSFASVGLAVNIVALPTATSRSLLQAELSRLSVLPEIAGVIVQMPLPPHLGLDAVLEVLDPQKDVDGIHPMNIGKLQLGQECFVPATPAGGIALLDYYDIAIEGRRALVIGRSGVVGKPLAHLLLAKDATVTIMHSRSGDLDPFLAEADIVASAVGKPGLIRGKSLKTGAVVLDFGAAVVNGKMTGDVRYDEALGHVGAITPVPGGTGPMTNAILLRNTLKAIRQALGHPTR